MRKLASICIRLSAFLAAAFILASCGGDDDPINVDPEKPVQSNKADLNSFVLPASSNSGLSENVIAYVSGNEIKFSIPEGMDPAKLVPSISVSDKAVVKLDGKDYKNGDPYDFTNQVVMTIVSESGKTTKTYSVRWEIGDNWMDSYIWKLMDECKVPGVSFSVMQGTKVVYSKGYGWAVKDKERVTPDHLFRMASISKQFCTLCIMRLKEQGKLKLDDKVFGEKGILKGIFRTSEYHDNITVRHLLSHSSGICAGLDDPAFNGTYRYFNNDSSRPVPTDTLIQRTLDKRWAPYQSGSSYYTPGALYNYSNVGFCVLHRIVEVVSGKEYETFLKEDVLKPMGITDTHIGGYQNQRRSNECEVYSQGGGNGYLNPLHEIAGAAGIITSTNQMMKILTYIDGDETVPDVYTKETLSEMYTPYRYSAESRNTYGLGWRMNNSKRFFNSHFHGGNMAGTATMWVAGATGDNKNSYKQPMSGAIVCNSRSYDDKIGWDTSWGFSTPNDIDDSFYIILGEAFRHFDK